MRSLSFLVTNDDGIESPFLATLVRALRAIGNVTVIAPSGERSWISKAMTRRGNIAVRERADLFAAPAWEIDGTPADCVNLGLGHLAGARIDAVVSGINIGSNAGLPLILASGTVGGALEGALHGRHAVATSMRLTPADFAAMPRTAGLPLPAHIEAAVDAAAQRTAELCVVVARRRKPRRFIVHNLNFPPGYAAGMPVFNTMPALMPAGSLFARDGNVAGGFAFAFAVGDERRGTRLTDRTCIETNRASLSILDFGRLGVPAGVSRVELS